VKAELLAAAEAMDTALRAAQNARSKLRG